MHMLLNLKSNCDETPNIIHTRYTHMCICMCVERERGSGGRNVDVRNVNRLSSAHARNWGQGSNPKPSISPDQTVDLLANGRMLHTGQAQMSFFKKKKKGELQST